MLSLGWVNAMSRWGPDRTKSAFGRRGGQVVFVLNKGAKTASAEPMFAALSAESNPSQDYRFADASNMSVIRDLNTDFLRAVGIYFHY